MAPILENILKNLRVLFSKKDPIEQDKFEDIEATNFTTDKGQLIFYNEEGEVIRTLEHGEWGSVSNIVSVNS